MLDLLPTNSSAIAVRADLEALSRAIEHTKLPVLGIFYFHRTARKTKLPGRSLVRPVLAKVHRCIPLWPRPSKPYAFFVFRADKTIGRYEHILFESKLGMANGTLAFITVVFNGPYKCFAIWTLSIPALSQLLPFRLSESNGLPKRLAGNDFRPRCIFPNGLTHTPRKLEPVLTYRILDIKKMELYEISRKPVLRQYSALGKNCDSSLLLERIPRL